MTTIYFSSRDWREANRNPLASTRANAVCRRLAAPADQTSHWYGAHSWAACALINHGSGKGKRLEPIDRERIARFRDTYSRELCACNEAEPLPVYLKAYDTAVTRVLSVRREALALPRSTDW